MDPKVPRTKASLSLAMMRVGVFMSLLTCTQVKCASVRHRLDACCCSISCSQCWSLQLQEMLLE